MLESLGQLFDWTLAQAVAIVALAGVVRGFSGFGSALILTPSLALLYDPQSAVPLVVLVEFVLSLQMLPHGWRLAERREVAFLSVMAVVAIPLGTWALLVAPPTLLRWVISLGILLFLAVLAAGWRRRGATTRRGLALTGLLAGAMNGATGAPGPPILLYYLGGRATAAQLRANVILFFFVLDCVTLPWMAWKGLVNERLLLIAVLVLPAAMLGIVLGTRLFPLASERAFRRIAFVIIGIVAILTLPVG